MMDLKVSLSCLTYSLMLHVTLRFSMYVRKWLKANVIAVHAVNVWSYFPTLSKEGFVNYQLGFESKVTQNAKV